MHMNNFDGNIGHFSGREVLSATLVSSFIATVAILNMHLR
jgi:hypothetical protein